MGLQLDGLDVVVADPPGPVGDVGGHVAAVPDLLPGLRGGPGEPGQPGELRARRGLSRVVVDGLQDLVVAHEAHLAGVGTGRGPVSSRAEEAVLGRSSG